MENTRYTEEIVYQWQKTWSEQSLQKLIDSCQYDTVSLPYFLKYLPKEGLILECGCGLGQWVIYLNRLGYHMSGVEIVPECVQICKQYFPEADVHTGDVRKLPFPDSHFSGYISIGVIEHMIEGPESTLQELQRIMKPGGMVVLTVPAFNYFMRMWYPVRKLLVDIFRNNALVRKLLGKPSTALSSGEIQSKLNEIQNQLRPEFWPIIGVDPVKGPLFVEYKCRKGLVDDFLKSAGFEIVESVPVQHPLIFHDIFGTLFFSTNGFKDPLDNPQLNFAGQLANKLFQLISPHFFNYVYLYVARLKK